jgi:hypothetical protein
MNRNTSFFRKVIYGGLIVALLIPLYVLGHPASSSPQGGSGGVLAQLRSDYDLAQANLGEIDPASESMKLATLGLRGVAANILWEKANEYKKKEDWDNLSATLNQITKLQPNFLSVWEFQGHNLAYNVSAEFDDYQHRYLWVKRGIDFLISGTEYNSREPRLPHQVGWFFGQKLGRADEYVQFRRMFRDDKDYHAELNSYVDVDDPQARGRHDQLPDNWLVGRLWYIKAENLVRQGRPLRGKAPLIFHADRPKSLMNHAAAIEEEGHFGEVAQIAWSDALADWNLFGDLLIPSTWGVDFRLNEYDAARLEVRRLTEELENLAPTARDELREMRLAQLTDEERRIYLTPDEEKFDSFTSEEWTAHSEIRQKMEISEQDLADYLPSDVRERGERIARKLAQSRLLMERIDRYRDQVNFEYWRTRCEAEQTETATRAREFLYEAQLDREAARLEEARDNFMAAWDLWHEIFEQFPRLKDDLSGQDLEKPVQQFKEVLGQLGEDIPRDFKLMWILEDRDGPPMESLGFDDQSATESAEATEPADSDDESSETPEPADTDEPAEEPAETAPEPADEAERTDSADDADTEPADADESADDADDADDADNADDADSADDAGSADDADSADDAKNTDAEPSDDDAPADDQSNSDSEPAETSDSEPVEPIEEESNDESAEGSEDSTTDE